MPRPVSFIKRTRERRRPKQLLGAGPSQWDEVIAAFRKSEYVRLPELLDIVVDVTRAVHGVSYHSGHNQKILLNVLEQLDQRNIYRSCNGAQPV